MHRKRKELEEISQRHFRRLKRKLTIEKEDVQNIQKANPNTNELYNNSHSITACGSEAVLDYTHDLSTMGTYEDDFNGNEEADPSTLVSHKTVDISVDLEIDNERPRSFCLELEKAIATDNENENLAISSVNNVLSFQQQIISWALSYKIPHNALTQLLSILKSHTCFESLPKHAKTLLRTPRKSEIRDVPPGQYCHFGIKPVLQKYLRDRKYRNVDHVMLQIGVDGLPISESSSNQLWPILCSIVPESEVFLIGCYFGPSKPEDPNLYAEEFIEECKDLITNGYQYDSKVITLSLQSIVGDAPAKSFLTNTKGHSGYDSCTKCKIKGQYVQNRVCFPGTTFEKREDPDITQLTDSDHYKGYCKLAELPNFGLVTNIPLDYMHLICVGVVKKLIRMWLSGPLSIRLPATEVQQISSTLLNFKKHIPREFSRKPRELSTIGQWKATESRQFLLYTGPFALKNHLPPEIYTNFIMLHAAIRILTSPDLYLEKVDFAENLLYNFVRTAQTLYGKHFIVHNVHNLLHLADDVRKFGTLDSFSAFKYENYMKTLKKLLRKSERPLQQLRNRYAEFETFAEENYKFVQSSKNNTLEGNHFDGPLFNDCNNPQYSKVLFEAFTLSRKTPNNCCILKDNNVILISNFATSSSGNICVIGKQFRKKKSLYKEPCASRIFDCFKVSQLSNLQSRPLSEIKNKAMILPYERYNAVISLLHNESQH